MTERFFIPRDAQLSLDEHGFLLRPDGKYGEAYNPALRQWTQLAHIPVVIILGEPGIGKSTVLALAQQNTLTSGDMASYFYDLGIYSDQATLAQELFGPAGPIHNIADGKITTLYLDSLDECKISIPTIERYLREKLHSVSPERLRLRIACRTVVWSSLLEEYFITTWGNASVVVFELAPLRILDVRDIAEQRELNADSFIEQIVAQNVGSLAARPGTLNLLLNVFADTGKLPTSRYELYDLGCRALLAEQNLRRRESGRTGRLTQEQRLAHTSRIAAVTMFANRGLITFQETSLETEADFREILDTGVFNSRGPEQFGWAHQTFAEFLAAHYLHTHALNTEQAQTLFINVNDPAHRIAPQLWETAAWYSVKHPEFLRWLLDTEPELVLRSDVQLTDHAMREQVVQAILTLADDNRYFDTDLWTRRRYMRLQHPHLAAQLCPFIISRTHGLITRRIAMDIAEACKLEDLSHELANVALDTSELLTLRINAAYAVQYIGNKSAWKCMRPLLTDPHDDDEELKGIAIKCLWPGFMSSEELFTYLTPPANDHFIGSYSMLFEQEILTHLQGKDCLPALQWVRNINREQLQSYTVGRFVSAIMIHTLDYLDDPTVCNTFAETAWFLLKQHDFIFSRRWGIDKPTDVLNDTNRRRKIALELLRHCTNIDNDGFYLCHQGEHLIRDEDIDWLLNLAASETEPAAETCAKLLAYRLNYSPSLEHLNLIMDQAAALAEQGKPALKKALSWLLDPIMLDSPEAGSARERYAQLKALNDTVRARQYPTTAEQLDEALRRCEAGETMHWRNITTALSREDDHSPPLWSHENIFNTPGWKSASPDLRNRIRTVAINYLIQSSAPTDDLTLRNRYKPSEFAGIPALMLAMFTPEHEPMDLSQEVWEKLTKPIVIMIGRDNDVNQWEQIFKTAAAKAPNSLFTAFQERLGFEAESDSGFHLDQKLRYVWNDRYEELLRSMAQHPGSKNIHLRGLLDFLFEQGTGAMDDLCRRAIHTQLQDGNVERAALYAATYLRQQPNPAWSDLWTDIQDKPDFGQAVVMKLGDIHDVGHILELDEPYLADFYLWLETAFPQAEDPELDGWVSPRHNVGTLRQEMLNQLKTRGTPAALAALDRIIAAFPDSLWLRSVRIEAENITRRATWQPLTPTELITFVENANTIIVRDAQELAAAIQQSLQRLQTKLTGHGALPPLAPALWDETSRRPKNETRISELIATHLHEDLMETGIIANREVEIRNRKGKGIGESVDLLVSCYRPDHDPDHSIASVVIEVKGCWNKDLYSDISSQLAERYLDDISLRYGLYVVGYFPADMWDDRDVRRSISIKNTDNNKEVLSYRLNIEIEKIRNSGINVTPIVLDLRY